MEFAVKLNGRMPAKEFLDSEGEDAGPVLALFKEMAETGRTANGNKFSQERGAIYAFKTTVKNRLFRVPCFQIGNRWVLAYGFIKHGAQKKRGKWRPEELDRADNIRKEHMEVEQKQRDEAQKRRNSGQR